MRDVLAFCAWMAACALVGGFMFGLVRAAVGYGPHARSAHDGLAETVRLWLADDQPAWETVEEFEYAVGRVLGMAPEDRLAHGGEPAWFPRVVEIMGADGEMVEVRMGGMATRRVGTTSPRIAEEMGVPLRSDRR